jgi:hypothetical protein
MRYREYTASKKEIHLLGRFLSIDEILNMNVIKSQLVAIKLESLAAS